jgi:crotonobetainyl-CoA:carnitine CoA-transferase CaiB-like acyl-CoA transferase
VAGYPGTEKPINVPDLPVQLTATPGGIRARPPLLGEHTDAILQRLGYSAAQIAELRAAKII